MTNMPNIVLSMIDAYKLSEDKTEYYERVTTLSEARKELVLKELMDEVYNYCELRCIQKANGRFLVDADRLVEAMERGRKYSTPQLCELAEQTTKSLAPIHVHYSSMRRIMEKLAMRRMVVITRKRNMPPRYERNV